MNRLAIPMYAIRHTQIGGTEFAIYNLIHGLSDAGFNSSLYVGRERDLAREFVTWAQRAPGVNLSMEGGLPGPKGVRFAEELWFQQRRDAKQWALFPNYFCPPKLGRSYNRDAVILHDIQYKCYPQYHSDVRKRWLDFYLPTMFDRAGLIALISKSELELVRQHFGEKAADKCAVVYNAVDWGRFDPSVVDSYAPNADRNRQYILSVCHQFPHKNVQTLLQAFSVVAVHDRDVELFLVGSTSAANKDFINRFLPEHVGKRVHLTGFVSDARLGQLYAGAALFALPSLYEGFGMPAVEALGLGVPTLVSRCSAMPEVTLGFADYVDDPLSAEEWANAIIDVMQSGVRIDSKQVATIRQTYDPVAIAQNLLAQMAKRT